MTNYKKLIETLRWTANEYKGSIMDEEDKDTMKFAAAAIEELQAELPKRGEWIDGDGRRVTARCSVCGHLRLGNGAEYANKYVHFCENCGSKMGGQNDEP